MNDKQRKAVVGFGICALVIIGALGVKLAVNLTASEGSVTDETPITIGKTTESEGVEKNAEDTDTQNTSEGTPIDSETALSALKSTTWISSDQQNTLTFYNYRFEEGQTGNTSVYSYAFDRAYSTTSGDMVIVLDIGEYGSDTNGALTDTITITCTESGREDSFLSLSSTGFARAKSYFDTYSTDTSDVATPLTDTQESD